MYQGGAYATLLAIAQCYRLWEGVRFMAAGNSLWFPEAAKGGLLTGKSSRPEEALRKTVKFEFGRNGNPVNRQNAGGTEGSKMQCKGCGTPHRTNPAWMWMG